MKLLILIIFMFILLESYDLFKYLHTSTSTSTYIPLGTIVIWSGDINNIPKGWKPCDGLEGRPYLNNNTYTLGKDLKTGNTGGNLYVSLPDHTHENNSIIGTYIDNSGCKDLYDCDIIPKSGNINKNNDKLIAKYQISQDFSPFLNLNAYYGNSGNSVPKNKNVNNDILNNPVFTSVYYIIKV
jgi:hypothetical protein